MLDIQCMNLDEIDRLMRMPLTEDMRAEMYLWLEGRQIGRQRALIREEGPTVIHDAVSSLAYQERKDRGTYQERMAKEVNEASRPTSFRKLIRSRFKVMHELSGETKWVEWYFDPSDKRSRKEQLADAKDAWLNYPFGPTEHGYLN